MTAGRPTDSASGDPGQQNARWAASVPLKRARVVVFNDHPVFKSAITWKVGEDAGIEFVANTVSVYETLTLISDSAPDAVDALIADLRIGDGNSEGIASVQAFAEKLAPIPVIVCTDFNYRSYASRLAASGASAVVQKSADPGVLVKAIFDAVAQSRSADEETSGTSANGSAA